MIALHWDFGEGHRVLFNRLQKKEEVLNSDYSIITLTALWQLASSVRLHKLFLFIEGIKSEHNLAGFLHVGNEYSVFLRKPKPHDKYLQYELYESKNVPGDTYKPRVIAISKVPVEYIKNQLKTFRTELYRAKYVDQNTIPGTQVKTMREWQIEKAVRSKGRLPGEMPILRSVL